MNKITHSITVFFLSSLGFMLTGCGQGSIGENGGPQEGVARPNYTVSFKKWRALDEEHQSLDCPELVSSLTPFQNGQAYDYVLREEEAEHYQFQQCRKAIQEQADAACREASDIVLHDTPVASFSKFEGVHTLDKTCLASVKQQVKDNVLHYHVVKSRDPFLVVEGTGDALFNLKKLTRIESTDATHYDDVQTFTVRANFGEKKGTFAYDVLGVFPDKASADAFVAALTGGNGSDTGHH